MSVVASSQGFFYDFFKEILSGKDNQGVFSTYSIFAVCSLLLGGCAENTEKELSDLLKVDPEKIHSMLNEVTTQLKKSVKLKVANGIFIKEGAKLCDDYVTLSKKCYDAEVQVTKFVEPGKSLVNKYVEKKTGGMIKNIIKDLSINTVVILANAIYFKANWASAFKKKLTRKNAKFQSFDAPCKVSMMKKGKGKEIYGKHTVNGVGFTSLRMPYKGGKFSMLFLLPDKKGAEEYKVFEEKVFARADLINEVVVTGKLTKLDAVHIPKFTVESRFELVPNFKNLGVVDLFDGVKADLSKLVSTERVWVSDIIHQAKMIVDESGTVAAAATVVVSRSLSMRVEETPKFILNRPFYCFLIHDKTLMNLFVAKIVKPVFKK